MTMDFSEAREGLREAIAWVRKESYECKRTKRAMRLEMARISHRFASALGNDLEEEGISIPWRKGGKANYFIAEIGDRKVCVSVFASHEQWWQTPSAGFLSIVQEAMTKNPTCRWGVALFNLPGCDGAWIEGAMYEKAFVDWPKKLNDHHVRQAVKKNTALKFSNPVDLINVIRKWSDPHFRLYKMT